jgi:hypothetical protein
MSTPTILIVPDRYKSGVLYSQLPESGAVDFDVTRATTAFRTNASGVLESVASGVPRLDYPAAGGCPSLLVEPAATNLALRSEDFTASGFWALTNATITANNDIAPDGTMTADTLTATALGGQVQGAILGVSGTTYTASFFIKRRTGTGVVNIRSVENLSTPITVTNNWTRVSLAATATSTTVRIGIQLGTSGDAVDIWGAQLETGSVATSYIPTTTASATRNADVISKTGVSGFIGQTQGTFFLDLTYSQGASTGNRWVELKGATNNIGLAVNSLNAIRSIVNGQSDVITTGPLTSGGVKAAWAYNASGVVFFANGTQYTLTNGGAQVITSLNEILINGALMGNVFGCRIRAAAIYTTRLSNTELSALTSL